MNTYYQVPSILNMTHIFILLTDLSVIKQNTGMVHGALLQPLM